MAHVRRAFAEVFERTPAESVSRLAAAWRRVLRFLIVCFGFAVFFGAQAFVAYGIITDRGPIIVVGILLTVALVVAAVWPVAGLIVLLSLTPLVRGFLGISGGSSLPDVSFETIMVPALAFFVLIRTLLNRKPVKPNLPVVLIVAYVIYCVANRWLQYGSIPLNTVRGIVEFQGFWPITYFIVLGAVRTERHVHAVLKALVVLAAFQGLALIFEHFTGYAYVSIFYGQPIPLAALGWGDIGEGRSVGLFSNPVGPSVFLAVSVPIALHLSRLTPSNPAKLGYWLAVFAICIGSFYTYTRNVYAMLILAILLMPILAVRNRRSAAMLAVAGLILVTLASPRWFENREFSSRLTNYGNVEARLQMNKTALNLISHHLWFGVGWGNYTSFVERYFTSLSERVDLAESTRRERVPATVHNAYLFVVAEQGLCGAFLYFGSLFGFLVMMWKYRKYAPLSDGLIGKDLFSIVFLYLLLLFVQFVPYSNYDTHTNLITWTVLGLGVRSFQLAREAKAAQVEAA